MQSKILVFDLDDTIYKEIDYLISAYREISEKLGLSLNGMISEKEIFNEMFSFYKSHKNPFIEILKKYNINDILMTDLLMIYRTHKPKIELKPSTEKTLNYLKEKGYIMGIITDGRSIQQRNKIQSLDIEKYFENIIISEEIGTEKPNLQNYIFFENTFPNCEYIYIGDNLKKDFVSANKLGWTTICLLDNGKNIHKQKFDLEKEYLPNYYINSIKEILNIIEY